MILAFDTAIDDVTTLSDLQQARAEHRIASIPVLTGTNSSEGRLFEVGQKDVTAFIAATLPESTELHQAVAVAYSLGHNGLNTQISTEDWYQCPSAIEVGAFSTAGYPTWRCYFDQTTQIFSSGGVYRSSEIIFGTWYHRSGMCASPIHARTR